MYLRAQEGLGGHTCGEVGRLPGDASTVPSHETDASKLRPRLNTWPLSQPRKDPVLVSTLLGLIFTLVQTET